MSNALIQLRRHVLKAATAGHPVKTIATMVGKSVPRVYAILHSLRSPDLEIPRSRAGRKVLVVPECDSAAILQLYASGLTVEQTAARAGYSKRVTRRVLSDAGVKVRGDAPSRNPPREAQLTPG